MSEYCKHCLHNPNGPFTCKFCGSFYPTLHNLVSNLCTINPKRNGYHSPAS